MPAINLDLIIYGLPNQMPTERELLATQFKMTLGSSSPLGDNRGTWEPGGVHHEVGDDALGKIALDRLLAGGVDLSHVVRAASTASGVTVILPHARERHILTYLGTISELRFEDLDLEYLASARHFHMSSLFLQRALAPRVSELFRQMKTAGLDFARYQRRS